MSTPGEGDLTPMEADEAAYRDLLGAYARKLATEISAMLPDEYSLRWE